MKRIKLYKASITFVNIFLLFLTGCESARVAPEQPYPFVINGLLDKAKLFIDLATIIFAQEPKYWGDAFKNIYYSALSLGRIKNINTLIDSSDNFHIKVWQIAPVIVRKYFYNKIRPIRTRFDYFIEYDSKYSFLDEAEQFQREAKIPFAVLVKTTRNQIEKNYKNCNRTVKTCIHCNSTSTDECLKERALEDLLIIQEKIADLIENKLPAFITKEKINA